MKKTVDAGKSSNTSINGMHRELMRLPDSYQPYTSNQNAANDNDDFIQSESDRQTLLIKYFSPLSLSLSKSYVTGFCIHLFFTLV